MEHSSEWVSTTSVLASERDSHLEFSDAEDASEDAAEYVTDVHEKEEDVWVTETSEVVTSFVTGEFHDQADAIWRVFRKALRGHNDTPCGRPNPSQGVFGVFSYY
jgi:hypothetical protein